MFQKKQIYIYIYILYHIILYSSIHLATRKYDKSRHIFFTASTPPDPVPRRQREPAFERGRNASVGTWPFHGETFKHLMGKP